MSTHNIYFYKENQKKKLHRHYQISPLLIFFLKYTRSRWIHILPQVFPVILKNLSTQCGNEVEYGMVRSERHFYCGLLTH